jgi:hypothetical protein
VQLLLNATRLQPTFFNEVLLPQPFFLKKRFCLFAANLFRRSPAAAPLFKKSCFQQSFFKGALLRSPTPPLKGLL